MIPASASRVQREATPTPRDAVFFVAGVAVLFVVAGTPLRLLLGEPGLVASEWLLLFVPALLFLAWGGWDPVETLSLRRPTGRGLAGGLLLVAGATPVGWLLAWLQTLVVPVPVEVLEGLQRMLAAESPARLLWLLFAVAVTPAVCEEVIFRGVLLGGTRRLEPWRFLLLNGVVFGAFHLSVATAIRFLPTAWLGIVIAWAVWRTGSLWVGILMHLANNGVIVLAAAMPTMAETTGDPTAAPPAWLFPPALLALAVGIRLVAGPPGAGGADGAHAPIDDPSPPNP